jgi:hypothetical protein
MDIRPEHHGSVTVRGLLRRSAAAALAAALALGAAAPESRADQPEHKCEGPPLASGFFCVVTDNGQARSRTITLFAGPGDQLGRVTLVNLPDGGGYDLHVCDEKRDGRYIHGLVTDRTGNLTREYHDPDGSSGPCTVHRLLYQVMVFRAIGEGSGKSSVWSPWSRLLEVRGLRPPTPTRHGEIHAYLSVDAKVRVRIERQTLFGTYRRVRRIDGPTDWGNVRISIPRLRPGRYRAVIKADGLPLGSEATARRKFRVSANNDVRQRTRR